jgi:RimJ/RimL family protein N-acetyltransferase
MKPSDVAGLYQTALDPGTFTYMPVSIGSLADMGLVVEHALAAKLAGTEFPFAIFDPERNRIVGSTRYLDISPQHRNLEIGWTWLAADARRTRINTECKYLLLRYAFESLGAVRVQIKTDSRNLVSQRAIERIGFRKEGVLRKHRILPDGYVRDTVMYSLVAAEWTGVKEGLQRILGVV